MLTLYPYNQGFKRIDDGVESHFTFSYANFFDPALMGVKSLKVVNQESICPLNSMKIKNDRFTVIFYIMQGEASFIFNGYETQLNSKEYYMHTQSEVIIKNNSTENLFIYQFWFDSKDLDKVCEFFSHRKVHNKSLDPKLCYWLQVFKGELRVESKVLKQGDALYIEEEKELKLNNIDENSDWCLLRV